MIPTYLMLGRYGDIISLLPLLKDEFERTKERQRLMVSKDYASVLDGVSYVEPVVFNGRVDELDRAYSEAQRHGEVRCLQIIGSTEAVKKCTYDPVGQSKGKITSSFQKEPYALAKRLDLWNTQPPVVFDRRSVEREETLIKQHLPKGKKTILVAAGGTTNPFPYRDLLLELLRLRFRTNYSIVDLSAVKAERIFDLIGLYENAYCLVACDSAPLHLARSCRHQLPVVALVNDKPSLWHGSSHFAEHIAFIRYSDFPTRALDMLEAISEIGTPRSYFNTRRNGSIHLIHAWSCYELNDENKERHRDAQQSWIGVRADNYWIDSRSEVGSLGRDSKFSNIKDEQRFPFLKDVIRQAAARAKEDGIIVITRCDTNFMPAVSDHVAVSSQCYAHRTIRDTEELKNTFHPIVDLFAFSKAWWKKNGNECPDLIMDNGWWWNRVFLAFLKKHGGKELPNFSVYRSSDTRGGNPKINKGIPNREKYNSELLHKWEDANGQIVLFPGVHKQLPTAIVNRHALHPYGYNASITEHNGRLLIAYRHHHQPGQLSTKLAIACLDDKFNVKWRKDVHLSNRGGSEEDPQLFVVNGKLMLAYVDSNYPSMPPKAVMRYGALVEDTGFAMPETFQPQYGKNDGNNLEKNWRFFKQDGDITWFVYSSQPEQVIVGFKNEKFYAEHKTPGAYWPWGEIKGGTEPLPFEGNLLRFFHSSLDNDYPPYRRRYYVGAMLIDPNPPYAIKAISREPVLKGSEEDDLPPLTRAACGHWKSKVVFPLGAIEAGGMERPAPRGSDVSTMIYEGWLLSVGINDAGIGLVKVAKPDLKL